MITLFTIYMGFCAILNIAFYICIVYQLRKEQNKRIKMKTFKYISDIVCDNGRFYIKVIYKDEKHAEYTTTLTFTSLNKAKVFRDFLLGLDKASKKQKGR